MIKRGGETARRERNGKSMLFTFLFSYLTARVMSVVTAAGTVARCLSLVVRCKRVGVIIAALSERQRDRKHCLVCGRNTVRSTCIALPLRAYDPPPLEAGGSPPPSSPPLSPFPLPLPSPLRPFPPFPLEVGHHS